MLFHQNFCAKLKNQKLLKCIEKGIHKSQVLLGAGENVRKKMFIPFQKEPAKKKRKISVIGATGFTGAALVYTLYLQNFCDEIVMFDLEASMKGLCGHALDILHSSSIRSSCPNVKITTNFEGTANSDVLIINAGRATKQAKVTRLELCQANIKIYAQLISPLTKLSPKSVLVVTSNPTEIMAYAAWKYSCFEKNRIVGAGTSLDSYRFRYHIGDRLGINPYSVRAAIIGEHGQSSVPVWSGINIAGTKLRSIDPCIGTHKDENNWKSMHELTVKDAPLVVGYKGKTEFGITMTLCRLVEAIITNAKTCHCVSAHISGLYGIETDCFVSIPCILGNRGVKEVVHIQLDDCELELLQKSVSVLDGHMKQMTFP